MANKNNNRKMVPEALQSLDDMKLEISLEHGDEVKCYGAYLNAR